MKKSAGVIVKVGNKCLLCKRNALESHAGEWSIPGGKMEEGEDEVETAHREFFEETNLELARPLDFVGVIKRMNREGTKQKGVMYVFSTEHDEEVLPDLENAKDGQEHTDCGYFGLDELPEPMNDTFTEMITNFLNRKQ